jgi:thiol-disulfide isomerase/thioredoxin
MIRRRRPPVRVAATTLFGALLLAACGSTSASEPAAAEPAAEATDGATSGSDSSASAAAFTQVFASATAIGQPFDGSSLAGTDAAVWFWAPWCTICRAEAPDVNATVERYGDRITFVGVGGRGDLDEMQGFIDDTETVGLPHVADLDGAIWEAFGVYAQPAFAFIDDSGDVEVFIGGLDEDALADRLDQLLA